MQIGRNVTLSQNSPYAQELCKWEAHYTQYGPPGRPYEYHPYPTRMYKATRPSQGGVAFEGQDAENDAERARLERDGYIYGGQAAALAALERRETEIAELAANRAFNDRRMSDKAQAEAAATDDTTIRHLAEIPRTPIKKRGRPVTTHEVPAS